MSLQVPGNTDPGRLDRRVSLQTNVPSRDAGGGSIPAWLEAATVWAGKQPVRGGRFFAAEEKQPEQIHVYRIRHRSDVRALTWRLVHGTDAFEIVYVEEVARTRFLDLTLRGIGAPLGTVVQALLLEGPDFAFLALEDGTPLALETAA